MLEINILPLLNEYDILPFVIVFNSENDTSENIINNTSTSYEYGIN